MGEKISKHVQLDEERMEAVYCNMLATKKVKVDDVCERMRVLFQKIGDGYQPRFVLNYNDYTAWEFVGTDQRLLNVEDEDIEWGTLNELPESALRLVREHKAVFLVDIEDFCDGVSRVSWQLTPDEGTEQERCRHGNACVKALKIYGYVNAHGQIVGKFRLLSDKDEEACYRQLAVEADKD